MSKRFTSQTTALEGVLILTRHPRSDHRGSLERMFSTQELREFGWEKPIADINITRTASKGTVRGMHYQTPPYSEMKLVQCIKGEVWDVAVDLRADSPTFLQWHGEILSPDRHNALLIPEGFAHGLQSLSDDVEMLYLHSHAYVDEADKGLNPTDPKLAIEWPLSPQQLSDKDQNQPFITDDFCGVKR